MCGSSRRDHKDVTGESVLVSHKEYINFDVQTIVMYNKFD